MGSKASKHASVSAAIKAEATVLWTKIEYHLNNLYWEGQLR